MSGGILDGRAWERSVSELLAKGLTLYNQTASSSRGPARKRGEGGGGGGGEDTDAVEAPERLVTSTEEEEEKEATRMKPIMLDLGANIGSHALYTANMGFQTCTVEPLTMNLVKVSYVGIKVLLYVLFRKMATYYYILIVPRSSTLRNSLIPLPIST